MSTEFANNTSFKYQLMQYHSGETPTEWKDFKEGPSKNVGDNFGITISSATFTDANGNTQLVFKVTDSSILGHTPGGTSPAAADINSNYVESYVLSIKQFVNERVQETGIPPSRVSFVANNEGYAVGKIAQYSLGSEDSRYTNSNMLGIDPKNPGEALNTKDPSFNKDTGLAGAFREYQNDSNNGPYGKNTAVYYDNRSLEAQSGDDVIAAKKQYTDDQIDYGGDAAEAALEKTVDDLEEKGDFPTPREILTKIGEAIGAAPFKQTLDREGHAENIRNRINEGTPFNSNSTPLDAAARAVQDNLRTNFESANRQYAQAAYEANKMKEAAQKGFQQAGEDISKTAQQAVEKFKETAARVGTAIFGNVKKDEKDNTVIEVKSAPAAKEVGTQLKGSLGTQLQERGLVGGPSSTSGGGKVQIKIDNKGKPGNELHGGATLQGKGSMLDQEGATKAPFQVRIEHIEGAPKSEQLPPFDFPNDHDQQPSNADQINGSAFKEIELDATQDTHGQDDSQPNFEQDTKNNGADGESLIHEDAKTGQPAVINTSSAKPTNPAYVYFGRRKVAYSQYIRNKRFYDNYFGKPFISSVGTTPGIDTTAFIPPVFHNIPLVIDLTGDGIKSIAYKDSKAMFDWDGSGFVQRTSWISKDDAMLVIDRNNNGVIDNVNEQFGFRDEQKGFDDLATLDSNNDQVIDANDAQFNLLRVWQDLNEDGITDPGELKTLPERSIRSISLTTQDVSIADKDNYIFDSASFTRQDGSVGTVYDVAFSSSTANTRHTDDYIIDADIIHLPWLRGYGRLRDLLPEASRNEQLKALVESLSEIQNSQDVYNKFDELLSKWSGTSLIGQVPDNLLDPQKVQFLSEYFNLDLSKDALKFGLKPGVDKAYIKIKNKLFVDFIAQTSIGARLGIQYEISQDKYIIDKQNLYTNLATGLNDTAAGYTSFIILDVLRTANLLDMSALSDAISKMPYASVLEEYLNNQTNSLTHVSGTTLTGNGQNNILYSSSVGNALVQGLDGNDFVVSPSGNDSLQGGAGNDVYIIDLQSGQDFITDDSGIDQLALGAGISKENLILFRNGNDLTLSVGNQLLATIQNLTGVHFGLDEKVECVGLYHLPEGIAGICRIPANGELVGSLVA